MNINRIAIENIMKTVTKSTNKPFFQILFAGRVPAHGSGVLDNQLNSHLSQCHGQISDNGKLDENSQISEHSLKNQKEKIENDIFCLANATFVVGAASFKLR
jgi:hypothetical protein